jgi:uncharacterized protein (DUF58 family)
MGARVLRLQPGAAGEWLRAYFAQWVRRRQGLDRLPVRLARRRLYILPTRAGLAATALLLLMLLAGLNYSNSLTLFLTFLLVAFALVVMQQCHRNLLGTEVSTMEAPPVFAGNRATLCVLLSNRGPKARPCLEGALPREPSCASDLPGNSQRTLALALAAPRRGLMRLERVRLATAYPFGLFRAWTWLHAPIELLVYPQPRGTLPLPSAAGPPAGTRSRLQVGADEWFGLRPFRDGDSPRQVDWKAYAREAPLLVKEYTQASAELRWLDFAQLSGLDVEARLSQLARWVVQAEACGERYGLRLPGSELAPQRGPQHRHRCLAALALYADPAQH